MSNEASYFTTLDLLVGPQAPDSDGLIGGTGGYVGTGVGEGAGPHTATVPYQDCGTGNSCTCHAMETRSPPAYNIIARAGKLTSSFTCLVDDPNPIQKG